MPVPIRAFVAERIIESLDVAETPAELSSEWKTEIKRRCRDVDEGTVDLMDADEVFKKAYARLS